MEYGRHVSYKFMKVLSRADTVMDELTFPVKFLRDYGDRLPQKFKLKLRNGYEVPVVFNKTEGSIKGLYVFLGEFRLTGGETLVFEYCGRYDLNLYLIGKDCGEIIYQDLGLHCQSGTPINDSVKPGGWRFLQFVNTLEPIVNEIEPPLSFLVNCGGHIKSSFTFVMSNGHKFRGSYNSDNNKMCGLEAMCEELGLEDFNEFHMILFTYDGKSVIHISVFDDKLTEIVFPQSATINLDSNVEEESEDSGNDCGASTHKFEITLQPFHMLNYSYGVNIPARFKKMWFLWRKTNFLQVHFGNKTWKLEIKPRYDWKRVSLNEGWTKFRDDLALRVGDTCLFECENPSDKFDKFRVKIFRKKN